jgi:hypothetical protein
MWLGLISSATMLLFALPAFADSCLFSDAPPFQLSSDGHDGQNCRSIRCQVCCRQIAHPQSSGLSLHRCFGVARKGKDAYG